MEEEEEGVIDSNDPNYDDENPLSKDVKLKMIDLEKATEQVGVRIIETSKEIVL